MGRYASPTSPQPEGENRTVRSHNEGESFTDHSLSWALKAPTPSTHQSSTTAQAGDSRRYSVQRGRPATQGQGGGIHFTDHGPPPPCRFQRVLLWAVLLFEVLRPQPVNHTDRARPESVETSQRAPGSKSPSKHAKETQNHDNKNKQNRVLYMELLTSSLYPLLHHPPPTPIL